jgi:hypothetical protein
VSHLETFLGADSFYLAGWVTADAIFDGTIDPDAGEVKSAGSGGLSDLVIHFTLDQGSRVEGNMGGETNITLSHDTLGFNLLWYAGDAGYSYECGLIPWDIFEPNPCDDYFGDMPYSGFLPAGDYTLSASTWAFEEDPRPGSCAVGCGSMGPFTFTLVFVPEPGTGTLLGAGLLAMAARPRVRRRPA